MADKGVMITREGARRTAETNRRVLGRHSEVGEVRRKVYWPQQQPPGGDDGGGNTSGPCGCCNCLDCVDLCDANVDNVVLSVAECPNGALTQYEADLGDWSAYAMLGGVQTVTFDEDTGTWLSAEIAQSGGVYQWEFTQAKSASTWTLLHVSGDDPVGITNGYTQVKWIAHQSDTDWSCLCNMQLSATAPDKFPAGARATLNCAICVKPVEPEVTSPNCTPVEGVVPCIEPFTFPELEWAFPDDPEIFPYQFDSSTAVEVDMEYTFILGQTCPATGSTTINATHNGPATVTADLNYGAGTLRLNFQAQTGSTFRDYYCDPATLVIGANTFTKQPLPPTAEDDSDLVTWPDTVTVTLSDCRFGSTHPDYGYGCGGSTGPCVGACIYRAVDSEGTLRGPVGPWTWSNPGVTEGTINDEQCTGTACGCPAAPVDPPTTPNDFYSAECVSE